MCRPPRCSRCSAARCSVSRCRAVGHAPAGDRGAVGWRACARARIATGWRHPSAGRIRAAKPARRHAAPDLARADADVNPAGDSQLWSTYETIRSATKKLQFKLPEPIDQLLNREKVPAPQVALIYGFLHSDGTPDVNMVQAELEKPGTHFDPKTWIHPSQKSHDAEIARAWAKRSPANLPISYATAEASTPEVAPEPLDMLIQQRVPVEQIATMKQIPVEEVEARARELGVILQDARNVYYPASKASAIVDQLAEDEAHKAAYDADQKAKAESRKVAVSKRVQELKAAGKSGAELKAAIDAEFPA